MHLWSFTDSEDCKQCPRVLAEVEHIDDDADKAGIDFVKIDDKQMAKEFGVFALPAIVFFKPSSKEPVIYAGKPCSSYHWIQIYYTFLCSSLGDLSEEEQILTWLLTQKDPSGDVIEDLEGDRLINLIEESGSIAVYFCKLCRFYCRGFCCRWIVVIILVAKINLATLLRKKITIIPWI